AGGRDVAEVAFLLQLPRELRLEEGHEARLEHEHTRGLQALGLVNGAEFDADVALEDGAKDVPQPADVAEVAPLAERAEGVRLIFEGVDCPSPLFRLELRALTLDVLFESLHEVLGGQVLPLRGLAHRVDESLKALTELLPEEVERDALPHEHHGD